MIFVPVSDPGETVVLRKIILQETTTPRKQQQHTTMLKRPLLSVGIMTGAEEDIRSWSLSATTTTIHVSSELTDDIICLTGITVRY